MRRRGEVLRRSAEVVLLRQHGEGCGATRRVGLRAGGDRCPIGEGPHGGGAPLALRDDREPRRPERAHEARSARGVRVREGRSAAQGGSLARPFHHGAQDGVQPGPRDGRPLAHAALPVIRTQPSQTARALPLSSASRLRSTPSEGSAATPATTSVAAALSATTSRAAPGAPERTPWITSALSFGPPPSRSDTGAGVRPSSMASKPPFWRSPSEATRLGPERVSSSAPPCPWTTRAASAPSSRRAPATRSCR